MNKELKILIDVLWTAFLLCLAFACGVCAAMYALDGAITMSVTGSALCIFMAVQAYLYVRDQGYL